MKYRSDVVELRADGNSRMGNMLSIAIDTSVYKADVKRNKPAFRALTRLIKGNEASLSVPYFIKREFVTKQQQIIGDAIRAIANAAGTILRNTTHDHLIAYARLALDQADQQQQAFAPLVEAEFDAWLADLDAEEYPLTLEQAQGAIDDYFTGKPPFKSLKNRNDIPDSFIWRSLLDIVEESDRLHFITADDALFDAAKGHPNIVPHRTLDDFIQTDECQMAIKNLWDDIREENIERVHGHLGAHELDLKKQVSTLLPKALTAKTISDTALPTEDEEATIYDVGSINEIDLHFDDASYYGESEIGIPFDAKVDCTLEYALYKPTLHRLSHDERKFLRVEDRNEYFFGIEDDRTIEAGGVLTLRLAERRLSDIALTDHDIEGLISSAEFSVDVSDLAIE
jgi:hypothetical protein